MKSKDEIRDQRMQEKYGVTLIEYNAELALHGGACAICKKLPKSRSLAVEHDHKVNQVKIAFSKNPWRAQAVYNGVGYLVSGYSKSEVSKGIKKILKRASWRGICCWRCNSALAAFSDNSQLMRAAASYLERFHYQPAVQPASTSGEKQ